MLHVYNGHDVDSYRTEVIRIIVSMGRHGGLNFLLENYSAMEDSMAIISKPFAESIPKQPWSIVRNGDLLKLVHAISHQRGRTSITGGWCKGHASEGDVLKGKVSETNRIGNKRADALAGEARCLKEEWGDSNLLRCARRSATQLCKAYLANWCSER